MASVERRTSTRRSIAPQTAAVTDYGDRAAVLLGMNQADIARSEALRDARLALAELTATLATREVEVSPTRADAASESEASAAAAVRLRRDVAERAMRLREQRAKLAEHAAELDKLRRAVKRSEGVLSAPALAASTSSPARRVSTASGSPHGAASSQTSGDSAVEGAKPIAALGAALRAAKERLAQVMGNVEDARSRGAHGSASADTAPPLSEEAEAEQAELRGEIDQLHRQLRALRARADDAQRERDTLEATPRPARDGSPNANAYASEAVRVNQLRAELERLREERAELRKLQWAQQVMQPTTGLRALAPVEQVREAMMFLKSTVIHFGQDLRKVRSVLRAPDKVQVFKKAHNELKIVVGMMLPTDEQLPFQRSRDERWPVSEQMLQTRFPAHKLDTSYAALQDMVVAWDAMSEEEHRSLTTAHDVANNAEVLYMMAQFVTFEWREKRNAMKQRTASPGGSAGAYH